MMRISSDSALKSALYLQQRLSLAVTGGVMKRSDSRPVMSALRSLGYPYRNSLVTTIQSSPSSLTRVTVESHDATNRFQKGKKLIINILV